MKPIGSNLVLQCVTCIALIVTQCAFSNGQPPKEIPQADDAKLKFFEARVRPILFERCYDCHGTDSDNESGLRLDSLRAILKGGRSGPAVVPGHPNRSLMILAIRHDPSLAAMPPKTKLPTQEIKTLAAWIKMGAPWPNSKVPVRSDSTGAVEVKFTAAEKSFWAFRPPQRPTVPTVQRTDWPTSPVDHFVLVMLESKGLLPASGANKRTLIRRATIDLHGVPPTPREVEEFLGDDSPNAFENLIERLLAAPRYGERWGRHWLDVARYADSNGMDDNMFYSDAWRYRDYVIAAFNNDKPYDQFVREQVAGDLLNASNDSFDRDEALIATGFLMIGPKMLAEDDPVKQRMDIVDDQIDTIGRAFLGLTLGCARCHDHKFDPIPTADYYSLAGIFKSTRIMLSYRVDSKWNTRALGSRELDERLEQLERELNELDEAVVLGNFIGKDEEKKRLTARLAAVKKEYAAIPRAMAVEDEHVEDLQVFLRGNHLARGPLAPRGFPRILTGAKQEPLSKSSSGRRELAEWLTRPDHPLTARVMVNRIWQGHFGQGLVRSPDNFGRLGQRPDNQPLLDWLAIEFVNRCWSIKSMHRLMMTSSSYRMSGAHNKRSAEVDPENRLLWRMNRRRMEAEAIRDSLLAVSGQLDDSMGGPVLNGNVFTILSATVLKDSEWFNSNRRSVYLPVFRSGLSDMFQAFDFPDPAVVNGVRSNTTIAPQALFMMNSELMDHVVQRMALRISRAAHDDLRRIESAYELAYGRFPSPEEFIEWKEHIARIRRLNAADNGGANRKVWESVCRVLLSSNEFVYIE